MHKVDPTRVQTHGLWIMTVHSMSLRRVWFIHSTISDFRYVYLYPDLFQPQSGERERERERESEQIITGTKHTFPLVMNELDILITILFLVNILERTCFSMTPSIYEGAHNHNKFLSDWQRGIVVASECQLFTLTKMRKQSTS